MVLKKAKGAYGYTYYTTCETLLKCGWQLIAYKGFANVRDSNSFSTPSGFYIESHASKTSLERFSDNSSLGWIVKISSSIPESPREAVSYEHPISLKMKETITTYEKKGLRRREVPVTKTHTREIQKATTRDLLDNGDDHELGILRYCVLRVERDYGDRPRPGASIEFSCFLDVDNLRRIVDNIRNRKMHPYGLFRGVFPE